MTREEYEKAYQEQRDLYAANILNQGRAVSQQQAAQGLANAQAASQGLVAPYTIWGIDTGDETDPKPINEVYAPEVKIESEEEKRERMWKAIQEFSST